MGIDNLYLFIAAGLMLNLTPGPDVLYIVANGLRGGARAGLAAALGITAGCFVHIAAAVIGVSALIAASATAFTVLKWLGAAYLVYVGASMLWPRNKQNAILKEAIHAHRTRATGQNNTQNGAKSGLAGSHGLGATIGLKKVFIRGFWTNALNAKVALFFLAFLPQFISPDAANPTLSFALLGLLFNLNALPINIGYGLGAAWVSKRLSNPLSSQSSAMQPTITWLERGAGGLFVYFGVKLALVDNRT